MSHAPFLLPRVSVLFSPKYHSPFLVVSVKSDSNMKALFTIKSKHLCIHIGNSLLKVSFPRNIFNYWIIPGQWNSDCHSFFFNSGRLSSCFQFFHSYSSYNYTKHFFLNQIFSILLLLLIPNSYHLYKSYIT